MMSTFFSEIGISHILPKACSRPEKDDIYLAAGNPVAKILAPKDFNCCSSGISVQV